MPGSLVSDQRGVTYVHCIPSMEHPVHLGLRIEERGIVSVLEIALAARFDNAYVPIHDHVFGACQLFYLCAASIVVEVSVADQQDLHVIETKPQLFNALSNQGN